MKRVRFKPAAVIVGVAWVALVISAVRPAAAGSVDAAADTTRAGQLNLSSDETIHQLVISEDLEGPQWFPEMTCAADVSAAAIGAAAIGADLTLAEPPVKLTALHAGDASLHQQHNTLIPLPPAAWTGLAGLGTLAALGWRKSVMRFLS